MIIKIPYEPMAYKRIRVADKKAYNDPKYKSWKQSISFYIKYQLLESKFKIIPKHLPVFLNITFNLTKPKFSKNEYPIVRPDLDNYTKAILDCGNNILWEDDSQIVNINCKKQYLDISNIILEIKS